MSLYDKILHERISSEEQLSVQERGLLQSDAAARNLIEENRMLELARPQVWPAPSRSQLLGRVYQLAPRQTSLLGFLGGPLQPAQLRSLVGSAALVIVLLSAVLFVEQYTPRWQRSEGFEVRYQLQAVPGSDLTYYSSQLAGEAEQIGQSIFADGSGRIELLGLEHAADGSLNAVLQLREFSTDDLARFDEAFSTAQEAHLTAFTRRSWFSSPRHPGHEFESRLFTINDHQVPFPEGFSASDVQNLNQLLSSIEEDDVFIRGMRLGDGNRFSLSEVVSLEFDDSGNVTILDSPVSVENDLARDYREILSGQE